jgi:hypothetical protein
MAMLASLALAGCVDRTSVSKFEPLASDEFRFEAAANSVLWPVDGPKAEAARMEWLETYLSNNHLCPNGYTITERKPVLVDSRPLGDAHTIYYRGRCK